MLEYSLEKRAFLFGVDPKQIGNVILGVTGAQQLSNAIDEMDRKRAEQKRDRALETHTAKTFNAKLNYYEDIKNVVKGMAVIFTPVSVVFKSGGLVVDILEPENMNEEMKAHWRIKDENYFRNLLFNKMSAEIQMAQQFVAQKLLERSMAVNDQMLGKQASSHEGEGEFQTLADIDVFNESLETLRKMASYESVHQYLTDIPDDKMFKIAVKISDWAGHFDDMDNDFVEDPEKKAFFEFGANKNISTEDARRNLKVYFLPDKVGFVINGLTVSHLPLTSMSEEAVEKFYNRDRSYFRNVFLGLSQDMQKQAAEESFFENPDASPLILVTMLNRRWDKNWVGWDPAVLIKLIEKEFQVSEIPEVNVDKVLISQAAILHDKVFTEPFIYEKCVRAFNNHPTELTEREDVFFQDIVNANRLLNAISGKDPHELFNSDVMHFIRDAAVIENIRMIVPVNLVSDDATYDAYINLLNELLLARWNDLLATERLESSVSVRVRQENEIIMNAVALAVQMCREDPGMSKGEVDAVIRKTIDYYDVDHDESTQTLSDEVMFNIIKNSVVKNLCIDGYVYSKMKEEKSALQ